MIIPSKFNGYARDGLRLYFKSGGSSAPPPDPALVAAQVKSLGVQDQVMQQLMANSKEMAPLQKASMQLGLDTSKTAYDQSQEDRDWMLTRRSALSGIQDKQVADAEAFNTADRREQLANQAVADADAAFSNAEDQGNRNLAARGVKANSGAALALNSAAATAKGAALAGVANTTREAARKEGYGLTDRANNSLAGYPAMGMQATGSGATFGGMGLNYANSAAAGMNSGLTAAGSMAGAMGANATGMYSAQANYKNGQDQIAASSNPMNTILGSAAGMGSAWALKKFF